MTQRLFRAATAISASCVFVGAACAQIAPPPPPPSPSYWNTLPPKPFERIQRDRVAPLEQEFDVSGLSIPEDEVHLLLPRGAIRALIDPKTEALREARSWLGSSRVVVVDLRDHPDADPDAGPMVVGVPVRVLGFHEVINLDVAGVPVAVTYAPLSDCLAVFDRRVPVVAGDGSVVHEVLDLEVTGAIYNANILMYDRNTRGLWSQMRGRAVGGMFAGTPLTSLPLRTVPATALGPEFDDMPVVNRDTGMDREYERDAYREYIAGPSMLVDVKDPGDELAPKTLGLAITIRDTDSPLNDRSWFVTRASVVEADGTRTVRAGEVVVEITAQVVAEGGTDDGEGARGLSARVVGQTDADVLLCTALYVGWSGMFSDGVVLE